MALAAELARRGSASVGRTVMLASALPDQDDIRQRQALLAGMLPKPVRRESLHRLLAGLFRPGQAAPAGAPAGPRPEGGRLADRLPLRILLVEDEPVNQMVAQRMLQLLGYKPETVANGAAAVQAAREQQPDVILMDIHMPEMDGFAATEEIRRLSGPDRGPRIIAMTANALTGDRERCLAAGMDDYISKPVTLPDLEAALSRCLSPLRA